MAILALASVVGFIAVKCRQPLIVAFIVTGLLAGPDALRIVGEHDQAFIETLSQFGIALLLFMVGLKLDLGIIKQTGPVALAVSAVMMPLVFLGGFLLCLLLGFEVPVSAFMGLALSFSSTIIAVKLLSDKRAIDSLYGRVALGVLIIEDLIVILVTVMLAGLVGAGEEVSHVEAFVSVFLKTGVLVILTALFIRFAAKPITQLLARNAEFLVIFCITFAALSAAVCDYFDLSKELGGLVAGIALASTPYNNVIAGRLSPIRDFLLLFFFANLGAHMGLKHIGDQLAPAIALSAMVLIAKPLLIMAIMYVMKFRKRTGFLTGITLSQISEFSLILMAMGFDAGFVGEEALNLITLTGLITMGLSTYLIVHNGRIYNYLENRSAFFRGGRRHYKGEDRAEAEAREFDVIVFGLGRYGSSMARLFEQEGLAVLGVDFDPEAVTKARESGLQAVYGDAADLEFAAHLPLERARVIVFCFHHYLTGPLITDLRRTLAKTLRDHGYKGHIAATSHHPEHDEDLPRHGIDVTLSPFEDAAYHGVKQITGLLYRETP